MRMSIDWLRDFTDLPADSLALVELLQEGGCAVERVAVPADQISAVYSGKIISVEPHPREDHLTVCQVEAGTGELLQIVSSAPTAVAGARVVTALDGATLPFGRTVARADVYGAQTEGRLCSIQDLGYTTDDFPDAAEDSIYILRPDTAVGVEIRGLLGLDDVILDFRPDRAWQERLSVETAAREIARLLQSTFKQHEPVVVAKSSQVSSDYLQLPEDMAGSGQLYFGRVVSDIRIAPSPAWLRQRLRSAGIRPVNTIKDITNYVRHELGYPLRAVDLPNSRGGTRGLCFESVSQNDADSSGLERAVNRACELVEQLDCGLVMQGGVRSGELSA